MSTSQKVEQTWETPSLEDIVTLTKQHVQAMDMKFDDPATENMVWQQAGMHHVLLRTVGRKSGNEHRIALPYWQDTNGHRIVVASYAGAPGHPSWYLNLADRKANPRVLCKVQNGAFWSAHEILDGDDYRTTWDGLVADRAWYTTYQGKTERRIPLVRLPETEPA